MITLDLGRSQCNRPECGEFLDKWGKWCLNHEPHPLALMSISKRYKTDFIDGKSRNMINKAKRNYQYTAFNYNDYLDDIFDINTSTPMRQGKVMTPAYLSHPKPIEVPYELCVTTHDYVWLGGFTPTGTLRVYCALAIVGEIGIYNTIIGHAQDKSNGAVNGLIDYTVEYLRYYNPKVKVLNYLDMQNCGIGLHNFKKSVGFSSIKASFVC